ncbi:hypothetical protein VTJ04DRAFT_2795 [Mycothermus thermophilus]|uniref:uncharacterized protein n=1 Tax=Humicola insolens TaxID=85995 RepID=UPI0037440D5E
MVMKHIISYQHRHVAGAGADWIVVWVWYNVNDGKRAVLHELNAQDERFPYLFRSLDSGTSLPPPCCWVPFLPLFVSALQNGYSLGTKAPEVPTLASAGYDFFFLFSVFFLLPPQGTPRYILSFLSRIPKWTFNFLHSLTH